MKNRALAFVLSTCVSLPAFAATYNDAPQGRSRAEVKKELAESKHDGTYMKKNGEYPLNEQTVKRQKAEHAAAVHSKDASNPSFDKHDEHDASR